MHRSRTPIDVPTVFVVDPDPSTGTMAQSLLDGSDVGCQTFGTCRDFLAAFDVGRPGCLVLEQQIADMSGFQLLRRLAAGGGSIPLVFVLARPSVSVAVELIRAGAAHVLEKPLRSIELLNAIHEALELDQSRRVRRARENQVQELVAVLTRKEREVLDLVALGRSVKAMAAQLDLSVRAVEQRRNRLMQKLRVETPLELMRFSVTLKQVAGGAPAEGTCGRDGLTMATGVASLNSKGDRLAGSDAGARSGSPAAPNESFAPQQDFQGFAGALATALRQPQSGGTRKAAARRASSA